MRTIKIKLCSYKKVFRYQIPFCNGTIYKIVAKNITNKIHIRTTTLFQLFMIYYLTIVKSSITVVRGAEGPHSLIHSWLCMPSSIDILRLGKFCLCLLLLGLGTYNM